MKRCYLVEGAFRQKTFVPADWRKASGSLTGRTDSDGTGGGEHIYMMKMMMR